MEHLSSEGMVTGNLLAMGVEATSSDGVLIWVQLLLKWSRKMRLRSVYAWQELKGKLGTQKDIT